MQRYSFSECLAHQDDPLQGHLLAVARGTARLWGKDRSLPAQAAVLSALVHDLGKANFWFQERIHKGTSDKNPLSYHSRVSAVIGWLLSKGLPEKDEQAKLRLRLSVFASVLKHHSDLREPWGETYLDIRAGFLEGMGPFSRQVATIDLEGMTAWLREAQRIFDLELTIPDLSEKMFRDAMKEVSGFDVWEAFPDDEKQAGEPEIRNAINFLFSFGCLLQMDKLHTATGKDDFSRIHLAPEMVLKYLPKVREEHAPSALDEIREVIRETVTSTLLAHREEHFFTITAPTGSGKTLAVLHAALQLRKALQRETGEISRMIYCLPFTAIIDQNHAVYRDVLEYARYEVTDDMLLKHHHLTDMQYRSSDPEFDDDGAALFVETWQSELVVTTFHQLLHTLFTGRNRNLKRLPTLRNAIVILDEVQALPCKFWNPIRRMFQAMGEHFGTRFILMTATKPLVFLPKMSKELLTDHEQFFQRLSRVRLLHRAREDAPLSNFTTQIVEEIKAEPKLSRMIVVNQKKLVREITEMLEKAGIAHPIYPLSGFLTPLDRRNRIEEIGGILDQNEPCIIVTTQLIEAGVDLSVDRVERDMAPLDAIIQAAGRCNRHAGEKTGVVRVWSLTRDEGGRFTGIYDQVLIEVTQEVLDKYGDVEEAHFLEMSQTYFERMADRSKAAEVPVDRILACGRFQELENKFQLIKDLPNQSFFVIQNEEDQKIWDRYQEIQEIEHPLERKRAFFSIRAALMERVIQVFQREQGEKNLLVLRASEDGYDKRFGYIPENNPGSPASMFC
jgi:CRISPR-associated endonuclease/helicase Cas3